MSSPKTAGKTATRTTDHITEYSDVFIVRITRKGKEHQRSFRFGNAATKGIALAEAVLWKNKMLSSLPKPLNGRGSYRDSCMPNKNSVGRTGISRYMRSDNRRAGKPKYLCYGVNFVDSDKRPSVKTFQVGRADAVTWQQELHASLTAEAFRSEWEWCVDNGVQFDPAKYADWTTCDRYPFVAPV